MNLEILEVCNAETAEPSELYAYLMAAARIAETVSFQMAQDHPADQITRLLRVAKDLEHCAQELLQRH